MTITLAARRTTILATLFATIVALFALTSAAHATFTSSISNGEVTMTGNGDSDILNLTPSGSLLAHDQIGGGFASAVDFNTAMAGNQTVTANNVGFSVTVNAGDGDDFVIVGAGNALQIVPAFTVNGGGGYDALYIDDRSDTTARTATFTTTSNGDQVSTSNGRDYTHPDVEATLFRFGSGSDTANALGVAEQTVVAAEGNAGDDTFNFGSVLGGVGSIQGDVHVDGNANTDTLHVLDTANSGGSTYLVSQSGVQRSGFGKARPGSSLDRVTLTTGSGPDSIYKTASFPAKINSGGGDDLVSTRDAVADEADCAGGSDFVLSDPLDTLASTCEASDRTLAAPPASDPQPGGTETPASPIDPPVQPRDTAAPRATVAGVPKRIKRGKLLRSGLTLKLGADEPAAFDVQLLGSAGTAHIARAYNLTLARGSLPLAPAARDLKLRPKRKLVGRARRFSVRLVVTATDAEGNRSTASRTVRVRP